MIICKIQGGIGNSMFQWAAAKSYSSKHGVEMSMDLSFYSQTWHNRKFELDKFGISNLSINNGKKFIIVNDSFSFKEIPYDINTNIYLDGYWQSEKYFKEYSTEIRNILKVKEESKRNILEKYPQISDDCMSLHVRRTDYVTSSGYHPVQNLDYYKNAIDIIGKYDYLFVFSDDINWCKENLKFDNMSFVEGLSDVEDMWLMSMCKNNIIANSSFSWWGGWLNDNKDKKIIAPSKWFGESANLNTSDLIPENWIKI